MSKRICRILSISLCIIIFLQALPMEVLASALLEQNKTSVNQVLSNNDTDTIGNTELVSDNKGPGVLQSTKLNTDKVDPLMSMYTTLKMFQTMPQYLPNVGNKYFIAESEANASYAFAQNVFSYLFNEKIEDGELVDEFSNSNFDQNQVSLMMSQALMGDVIMGRSDYKELHYMIFIKATNHGVLVYDCDFDNDKNDYIGEHYITFQEFANYFGNVGDSGRNTLRLLRANNYEAQYGFIDPEVYDDSVNFTINQNVLVSYVGTQQIVVIPDTVTAIGDNAFENNITMKSIVIPNSVTTIGNNAFNYCGSMEGIYFPDSVDILGKFMFKESRYVEYVHLPSMIETIPDLAFADLSNLEQIEFPDSVKTIGSRAFMGCRSFTNIRLPKNLESLGGGAFELCTHLESIYIPKKYTDSVPTDLSGIGPFVDCDKLVDIRFEKGTTIIPATLFSGCTGIKDITIPDTVTAIYREAFYCATNLEKIHLSDRLDEISFSAFENCTNLRAIDIPDSVTTIQPEAFKNCTYLQSVYLSDSMEGISTSTFESCLFLDTIVFPKKLETIDDRAFQNCNSLTQVKFPNTLVGINAYAFNDCNYLETVVFPNSLSSLGTGAFMGCDGLRNITFGTGLGEIAADTFDSCGSLRNVVLPCYLYKMDDRAFGNNPGLLTVRIPKAVTSISNTAFEGDSVLTIEGYTGSEALNYAINKGIPYRIIDAQPSDVVEPDRVSLNEKKMNLYIQETKGIQLDLIPMNCTRDVIWSSSDGSIADVDGQGNVTGYTAGTAVITVSVGNKQAQCEVTVWDNVDDIVVASSDIDLYIGQNQTIDYTVSPITSNHNVFFTSSDDTIASVDDKGVITAKSVGTAKIELIAQDANKKKASFLVHVLGKKIIVNTLEEFQSEHPYGNNLNDSYVYIQKGAKTVSVTFSSDTYVHENKDYIRIYDKNEMLVGTYTGTQLSNKTIKVKGDTLDVRLVTDWQTDDQVMDTGFRVISTSKPLKATPTSIVISKKSLTMTPNTSTILTATVLPKNSYDKSVHWVTSDPSVVSVENGVVTAQDIGTAMIFAQGYNATLVDICMVSVENSIDGLWVESIPSSIYTGQPIQPELKVYDGEKLLTFGQDYKLSYKNNTNVGNVHSKNPPTVIVKGIGNYKKSVNAYFEIKQQTLHSAYVRMDTNDVAYNGKTNQSKPIVIFRDKKLKLGKDYTLQYVDESGSNCKGLKDSITTIKVQVTGKGNYKGTRTVSYKIVPKDIKNTKVEVNIPNQVFTGEPIVIEPTLIYSGDKSKETLIKYNPITQKGNYTLTYTNNKYPGTAQITVEGVNDFAGKKIITFKILPKPLTHADITSGAMADQIYSPDGAYSIPTIYDQGVLLSENYEYTVSYQNAKVATGTNSTKDPIAIITGKENYSGVIKKTFKITPKSLLDNTISVKVDNVLVNNQKSAEGKVVVKDGTHLLKQNRDYNLFYFNNSAIGTATVVIQGIGNYKDSLSNGFNVLGRVSLSDPLVKVEGMTSPIYNGKSVTPDFDVTYMGQTLTKNVDYKVSYKNTVQVGDPSSKKPPTIIITGIGFYQGTITQTYTIQKYKIIISDFFFMNNLLDVKDVKYVSGKAACPKVTLKYGKKTLVEGVDYISSYANNTAVRDVTDLNPPTVIINGIGNYFGTINLNYRIYEKELSTLSFSKIGAYVYTGKEILPNITVKDKSTNTVLEYGKDYMVSYQNNINIGYGEVIITGKGTYGGTKKIKFLILPRIFKWMF